MKHDEECPRPSSEFPCCPDQMCPCDREELDATMLAFEKLEEELDATMMVFNILKKENDRLRTALENIANPELCSKCEYQMKLIDCMHGRSVYEIARAALEEK